ncbi:hypothetical protein EIP91_005319 [Steccherinum ochraceum]|uniref:Nuclear pore complex protein Nup85 n=1 Tax=Steccherinum ochraceum TaxID=92696 RepID=A0A4R0RIB7_9APHY|nr:hypothetical protein EIP91_005319 [Steccherinum ochraceum]
MAPKASSSLLPPLFEQGSTEEFKASGRTLAVAASPRDGSIAVYPTNNKAPQFMKAGYPKKQPIYFVAEHLAPDAERRTFLSDTSVIFNVVQNLVKTARARKITLFDNGETLGALRKLAQDYVNFCKECWIYAAENKTADTLQFSDDHYRQLHTCLSLFTVLYVPEPGLEGAPAGEDLLDWLNTHFVEPSTDEGKHLATLDKPWEDESYWSYLARATLRGLSKASAFFLETLSKHPSPYLQDLSRALIPILSNHPRFSQFSSERDFAINSRRWRDKVKTLRVELDRVPEDSREDGFDNWWAWFSDIVGVLEGRAEVVKRVCTDLGGDWKEVCVAWTMFVDPRLRRQDLPDIVVDILDDLPPDPTNQEDVIHSSLFLGKPVQALSQAAQLDVWLSAHLADMMEALELIEATPTDDSDISLRNLYIIQFAEYLHSDLNLWRHTVDYLCTCGDIGMKMADEVLVRVPLRLQSPKDSTAASEESARIRAGDLAGVLKEVNASCFDHGREEVRRMVCKAFTREKEYGLALSYCASAEDWPGLGRIVDRVLNEYVSQGPSNFARSVANIAPSLHALRAQSKSGLNGVFIYRLIFAVRFAEFHQRKVNQEYMDAAGDVVAMLKEEVAPRAWWAVVLCDAVDLLQNHEIMPFTTSEATLLLHKLEEVVSRSSYGAGKDYLAVLAQCTKNGDEKFALQQLQSVRLALAKYYARALDVVPV